MAAVESSQQAVESDSLGLLPEAAPPTLSYNIVDLFTTFEDVQKCPEILVGEDATEEGIEVGNAVLSRLVTTVRNVQWSFWLMLFCLGVLTALISWAMDMSIDLLLELRHWLCGTQTGADSPILSAVTLAGWSLGASAVAVFCCHVIAPEAMGSGIPELKTILSGVLLPRYLSLRAFVGKTLGLTAALAGGLSVGKEGPFVHIAAIIANQLAKLPPFRECAKTHTHRLTILGVAVSAGVTATFGAPVGGVLFAIEVTATFFFVNALWKAYFCVIWAVFTFRAIHAIDAIELFAGTDFQRDVNISFEILGYAVLGCVCGCLGGVFIYLTALFMRLGRRLQVHKASWYLYTFVLMLPLSVVGIWEPYLSNRDRNTLTQLFSNEDLDVSRWRLGEVGSLLVYVPYKLIVTALSLSCPVPCGLFTPVFVAGAAFGRLFGRFIASMFGASVAASYAVVGAAALAAGVTRTISVTVIVFELTGQLQMMLPVLLAVLMAYVTNAALSISVYEMMLRSKRLPYLPAIRSKKMYSLTAADIMFSPSAFTLPIRGATLTDALICRVACLGAAVPLVASREHPKLVAVLPCAEIDAIMKKYRRARRAAKFYERWLRPTRQRRAVALSHGALGEAQQPLYPQRAENGRNGSMAAQTNEHQVPQYTETPVGSGIGGDLLNASVASTTIPPLPIAQQQQQSAAAAAAATNGQRGSPQPPLAIQDGNLDLYDISSLQGTHFDLDLCAIDWAPLTVMPHTPVSKLHFLFTMLNIGQLFVCDGEGQLIGVVTRESFIESGLENVDPSSQLPPEYELLKEKFVQSFVRGVSPAESTEANHFSPTVRKSSVLLRGDATVESNYFDHPDSQPPPPHHVRRSPTRDYSPRSHTITSRVVPVPQDSGTSAAAAAAAARPHRGMSSTSGYEAFTDRGGLMSRSGTDGALGATASASVEARRAQRRQQRPIEFRIDVDDAKGGYEEETPTKK